MLCELRSSAADENSELGVVTVDAFCKCRQQLMRELGDSRLDVYEEHLEEPC